MTLLVLSCLWVVAGVGVAMVPMRHQYVPGIALLLTAPILIYWIGRDVALWAGVLAGIAFLSMFRKPLRYFGLRALGRKPEVPR